MIVVYCLSQNKFCGGYVLPGTPGMHMSLCHCTQASVPNPKN